MPTLYLICGLPGAGKTTLARQLEKEHRALRLCPDEWMSTLYGPDPAAYVSHRDGVEAVQWAVAERVLTLGKDVVLEYGFWSRAERVEYRRRGVALGALVELIYLDVPLEQLWSRLESRNAILNPGTLHVCRSELENWWKWFEAPSEDELL